MPMLDPAALNDGLSKREVFGRNVRLRHSRYVTEALTAVFNGCFGDVVAASPDLESLAAQASRRAGRCELT